MKESEATLSLRYSHAEHLLKALNALPEGEQKSITHTDLVKRISTVCDAWKKAELHRKATQNVVLKAKYLKSKKRGKTQKPSKPSKPTK
jgi:hypothetical protein